MKCSCFLCTMPKYLSYAKTEQRKIYNVEIIIWTNTCLVLINTDYPHLWICDQLDFGRHHDVWLENVIFLLDEFHLNSWNDTKILEYPRGWSSQISQTDKQGRTDHNWQTTDMLWKALASKPKTYLINGLKVFTLSSLSMLYFSNLLLHLWHNFHLDT